MALRSSSSTVLACGGFHVLGVLVAAGGMLVVVVVEEEEEEGGGGGGVCFGGPFLEGWPK